MDMAFLNNTSGEFLKWEYQNPQKVLPFWFEKVDGNDLRLWARGSTTTCGIICSVYLLFVWLGPIYMKNRKPYNLEKPLATWNFFLSIFSLTVVIRLLPDMILICSQDYGWYKLICVPENQTYATTFWSFVFILSKILELGDTAFIVLRKKPLVLLHWFHHFNMLWSSFLVFGEGEPCTKLIIIVNSFVHILMYAYFGFRVLKVKVPKKVAKTITALQITQFVVGLSGQYQQLVYYNGRGKPCFRTRNSLIITTVFGFSYLFLFMKLFYTAYIAKPKSKTA